MFEFVQNVQIRSKTSNFQGNDERFLIIPQGIGRDPHRDITYISDIGSNHIHLYRVRNH